VPRYTVEEYQRHYGQARALINSAEAIILQCGQRYMELAERWHRTGEPFTREDDAAMQRHFRDSAIYLGHISARHDIVATEVARLHFGSRTG
jgi:hypothetical protein